MSDHVDKARAWDMIAEKNDRIARLRAALEPFAQFARGGDVPFPSADDWQRASAVHTNTEPNRDVT